MPFQKLVDYRENERLDLVNVLVISASLQVIDLAHSETKNHLARLIQQIHLFRREIHVQHVDRVSFELSG